MSHKFLSLVSLMHHIWPFQHARTHSDRRDVWFALHSHSQTQWIFRCQSRVDRNYEANTCSARCGYGVWVLRQLSSQVWSVSLWFDEHKNQHKQQFFFPAIGIQRGSRNSVEATNSANTHPMLFMMFESSKLTLLCGPRGWTLPNLRRLRMEFASRAKETLMKTGFKNTGLLNEKKRPKSLLGDFQTSCEPYSFV